MRTWIFIVFLQLFTLAVPAQPKTAHRLAPSLVQKIFLKQQDSVWVSVSTDKIAAIPENKKWQYSLEKFPGTNIYHSRLAVKDLIALSQEPGILFISEILSPVEELTTGAYDLTLNRINYVHARFPLVNGNGINVSVKERLFDPADIDMKGRVFTTGQEAGSLTPHAALMATMIAGGANSSPFAQGIAWRSKISSSNFANLFPDPGTVFSQYKISVQNHSYGTIIENFYGNEAMAYDQQANQFPWLLHVFSSGNSGTQTPTHGLYAGINGFSNLTGNFKQAKNMITVGSVDSSGLVMPLSSKGPAFDGRIKPELVAYGEDGSSGAAATVSGTAVLLQHAFQNAFDSLPPSSLVKAILVNSADDAGQPHPDYLTGFGNLNAYRAVNTISQNRFVIDELHQSDTIHIPLQVGNDISRIKITLSWNDPAAVAGTTRAIVNQLDLRLGDEDGSQVWLPWVLDPSPSISALQSVATRKNDTLNTIEQVTVDFPDAGIYDIQVIGTGLSGSQKFALTWQLDTVQHFYWTYPANNGQLIAGNTHWLRWTTNRSGGAQLEYETGTGNWQAAGLVTDVSLGYFKWRLPDTVTTARIRMRFADTSFSLETFSISPQLNMHVGYNCADSFLLYWNKIHTGNYQLYQLGAEYLEAFAQVQDTFIVLKKTVHPSIYYSVAPLIGGKAGIPANTVNYPSLGPACYINAFYLQSQSGSTASFMIELGSIFGITEMAMEKRTSQGYNVVEILAQPPGISFVWDIEGLSAGENHFRLRIKTSSGSYIYSDVEIVYYWLTEPVLVYPNPVKRGEHIRLLAGESGRFSILLSDANGRMLHRQVLNSTRTEISTDQFSPGIYWISIFDRQGRTVRKKIMIQ